MQVLITAGPTREYLDPVRYISNDSSGRMGIALAESAAKLRAKVKLVHGPISAPSGASIRCIPVTSANDMFRAVKRHYRTADIIICAAAVADFRPAKVSKRKIKKTTQTLKRSNTQTLKLIQNPDILEWLGKHKRKDQLLIGFALETNDLIKNALAKLKKKNADIVVANMADVIGKDTSSVTIFTKSGLRFTIKDRSKRTIAANIIKFAQKFQNS